MKPSRKARLFASITLSKGKMYEYEIPIEDHIEIPSHVNLEHQFPLAIGTLGDFSAEIVANQLGNTRARDTKRSDVIFSAQVLSAIAAAKIVENFSELLLLLAAAGFYLAGSPGTATAIIRKINASAFQSNENAGILHHVLAHPWVRCPIETASKLAEPVLDHINRHYSEGEELTTLLPQLKHLRKHAYAEADALDFLLLEVFGAVVIQRYRWSAWTMLPESTALERAVWAPFLSRTHSIKEFWPSQMAIAHAGVLRGNSAVVQMPTSAGKTKATELIIRAAFRSARTNIAVIVAPFRALCHEIANDLNEAFSEDGYSVNQLSDALQKDYIAALFDDGVDLESRPKVLVITPEKLVYALRQEENFLENVGLLIYDEAHQFDTGRRGVTYELLLTTIKNSTPAQTQSVLISAVIGNANDLARWLFNDEKKIVEDDVRQSRRTVAFTSLPSGHRGQLQFQPAVEGEQGFFVPGVISRLTLDHTPRELPRFFPTDEPSSIALYLGLKLAKFGPVAIYSRLPASATKIAKQVITYLQKRNAQLTYPSAYSNQTELERLHNLYVANFGSAETLSEAAKLGVFVHHGETPHGVRLAIEHAMKESHIRFIACTSTLAQGVNLPIRYLIINSSLVGPDAIKARDFQNLIGRSGRAGMHEEGTVIFSDPTLFDKKGEAWNICKSFVDPNREDATGSSLLNLIRPPTMRRQLASRLEWEPEEIIYNLIDTPDNLYKQISEIDSEKLKSSVERLKKDLKEKYAAIEAIESFLMISKPDRESTDSLSAAGDLARSTFAYSLADDQDRARLESVFVRIAQRINSYAPQVEVQHRYGRSLLGLDLSLKVDEWVDKNEFSIAYSETTEALFETVWDFFVENAYNSDIIKLMPKTSAKEIALMWIAGDPYHKIMSHLEKVAAKIQHAKKREAITCDTLVNICERGFGFEFCLYLSAIKESYINSQGENSLPSAMEEKFDVLAKRLKYGLPTSSSIAHFEAGFADRVIAQELSEIHSKNEIHYPFESRRVIQQNKELATNCIRRYPDYYDRILSRILK